MAGKNFSICYISGVVASYFLVSILLVFCNKLLLSGADVIVAPLFVTWYQCLFTAVSIYLLGRIKSLPFIFSSPSLSSLFSEFSSQRLSYSLSLQILPLSLIFVGMVTFNNLCLQYVEVSFYNVARALTIVFNVIFSLVFLSERTSLKVIVTLCVVIIGFFVGADGEINFSLKGTIFGVCSSAFVCLNSIYTKRLMTVVNGDKWRLSFYNNVNAILIFLPLIFITSEYKLILARTDLLVSGTYWFMMSVSGLLGFAIGIVTVMQINCTSPLTHNISGTAKACVQTMFAYLIWKNESTFNSHLGNFLVIGGSLAYAWVRLVEMNAPAAQIHPEQKKVN